MKWGKVEEKVEELKENTEINLGFYINSKGA